MITFKHVFKNIPSGNLLIDINFTLGNKEKVGLIGQNGCGKTTLLRIIMGEEDYDSGRVDVSGEVIAYLPQLFSFPSNQTVCEYGLNLVGQEHKLHQFTSHLFRFGFDDELLDVPVHRLSSGQQMKVKLAELLLLEPTVLILDEPTNHLDIEGIRWMEEFVRSFDGVVMMVSHDRAFLDGTVDKIFEIDEKKLHEFPGNYTDYIQQKQHWVEKRKEQYKRQEQKREQMERLIENARKLKGGKSRGRAVRSAKKRMEREVLRNEINQYQRLIVSDIGLQGSTHREKLMLRIRSLSKHFGERTIFNRADLEIRGKERIWIEGHNGLGKTTLLEIITGSLLPDNGNAIIGEAVRWGYFKQDQKQLDFNQTVREFISQSVSLHKDELFSFLRRYLFPVHTLGKKLGQLSPGERARLAFGLFAEQELDLLILDEPTNHLDIWTKEAIEQALRDFAGAILLVSHDRYFVKQVGIDRIVTIRGGKLTEVWEHELF